MFYKKNWCLTPDDEPVNKLANMYAPLFSYALSLAHCPSCKLTAVFHYNTTQVHVSSAGYLYMHATCCSLLVNEANRCTEFQFYWYYDSTCFGQSFCPSSGVLTRTSALVKFMQFGDRVLPGVGWNWKCSVALATEYCINCTNDVVRLRTPDDGQKDRPKHLES